MVGSGTLIRSIQFKVSPRSSSLDGSKTVLTILERHVVFLGSYRAVSKELNLMTLPFVGSSLIRKTTHHKSQEEDTQINAKQANGSLEEPTALFYDVIL